MGYSSSVSMHYRSMEPAKLELCLGISRSFECLCLEIQQVPTEDEPNTAPVDQIRPIPSVVKRIHGGIPFERSSVGFVGRGLSYAVFSDLVRYNCILRGCVQ